MRIGVMKRLSSFFLFLIFLAGFVYAVSVLISGPWHPAQQIVNSGGSVFNEQGQVYRCDRIGPSSGTEEISDSDISHPLSTIAISEGVLETVDQDSNGFPDVGLSLTGAPDQLPSSGATHSLKDIFIGSRSLDQNDNGWPDACDCVLDELDTDEQNCGSCGTVCSSGLQCVQGSCVDTQNDMNNCGQVGLACSEGFICHQGICLDLENDENNCGLVGRVCPSGSTCNAGSCSAVQSHDSGFGQTWSSEYGSRSIEAGFEACQKSNGAGRGAGTCEISCIRGDSRTSTQKEFSTISLFSSWVSDNAIRLGWSFSNSGNNYDPSTNEFNCVAQSGNMFVSCGWHIWYATISNGNSPSGKVVWCDGSGFHDVSWR
jgi:hypothetical protein